MNAPATPPLVSVVICNYNYERYLVAALDSALAQDYPALEVVVVDDGSTDGSLQRLAERSGFRLVTQANGGQVSAYNTAYAAARGTHIVFLDADDLLDTDTVSRAMALVDASTARVQFPLRLVDADGRALGPVVPRRPAEGDLADDIVRRGVLVAASPGSGNLYSRAALERLMPIPIDPQDRHGADFYLIYGASVLGATRSLPTPAGSYRVHASAETAQTSVVFGNAAAKVDEYALVQRRAANFKRWLQERTGIAITVPLTEFGIEKQDFAKRLFSADAYLARLRAGWETLPRVLRSIRERRSESMLHRAGLTVWALCVVVLPRALALPLARYVCNPGSRR